MVEDLVAWNHSSPPKHRSDCKEIEKYLISKIEMFLSSL